MQEECPSETLKVKCPVRFVAGWPDLRAPPRADATLAGAASHRAALYCQPFICANSFGWHIYPPLDVDLLWDGISVKWRSTHDAKWADLDIHVDLENFARLAHFAPESVKRLMNIPIMATGPEMGIVQLWTGFFVISEAGWCSLIRPVVNAPKSQFYDVLEGIIDTDWWLGPLIFPIQIRKTDRIIKIRKDKPIAQLQPIPRVSFSDDVIRDVVELHDISEWTEEDWRRYQYSMELKKGNGKLGTYRAVSRKYEKALRTKGDTR